MQLDYTLTRKDWTTFSNHVYKKICHVKQWQAMLISALLWFCIALAVLWIADRMGWAGRTLLAGVFAGYLLTLAAVLVEKHVALRRLEAAVGDFFLGPHTLMLDESGVGMQSANSRSRYAWPVFGSAAAVDGLLMLFMDRTIAIVIPLRDFDRQAVIAEIEKLSGLRIERDAPPPAAIAAA